MKEKRTFYCEASYVVGIIVLALGTAFMEKANFGMSMVVAPAYLIHLKVSQFLPFFSFGMSEYVFQALLLAALSLISRKIKKSYFLSFVTAFIYGVVLDAVMSAVALIQFENTVWRIIFFIVGMCVCSVGVALLFNTYLPPEAYELFVKEISQRFNATIVKTKTIYDFSSCIVGVILSLCCFGTFIGVSWGTVICATVNGWLIGRISRFLETRFVFKDALPLRDKME